MTLVWNERLIPFGKPFNSLQRCLHFSYKCSSFTCSRVEQAPFRAMKRTYLELAQYYEFSDIIVTPVSICLQAHRNAPCLLHAVHSVEGLEDVLYFLVQGRFTFASVLLFRLSILSVLPPWPEVWACEDEFLCVLHGARAELQSALQLRFLQSTKRGVSPPWMPIRTVPEL